MRAWEEVFFFECIANFYPCRRHGLSWPSVFCKEGSSSASTRPTAAGAGATGREAAVGASPSAPRAAQARVRPRGPLRAAAPAKKRSSSVRVRFFDGEAGRQWRLAILAPPHYAVLRVRVCGCNDSHLDQLCLAHLLKETGIQMLVH